MVTYPCCGTYWLESNILTMIHRPIPSYRIQTHYLLVSQINNCVNKTIIKCKKLCATRDHNSWTIQVQLTSDSYETRELLLPCRKLYYRYLWCLHKWYWLQLLCTGFRISLTNHVGFISSNTTPLVNDSMGLGHTHIITSQPKSILWNQVHGCMAYSWYSPSLKTFWITS